MRARTLAVLCAIALTGCARPQAPAAPEVPDTAVDVTNFSDGRTYKYCDQGRAVYVLLYGNAGGITVVENAKECPQPVDAKAAVQ